MKPSPANALVALLLLSALSAGCAGYAGKVQDMRTALRAGQKEQALKSVNAAMKLSDGDQYPKDVKSESTLLLLERASIKQSMGTFKASAYDFRIADQHLELMDIKNKAVGEIAKWIFSGSAGTYRAPSHEKMMLSALNLLNYLAMGDLESARIEARRLDITQQYLKDGGSEDEAQFALGDYLSGFTFEQSGRYEQAVQQYTAAIGGGGAYPSLSPVLLALAGCTSYRNEYLEKVVADAQAAEKETEETPAPLTCQLAGRDTGTLLIISATGLAPHKRARRVPIGAAIVLAGAFLAPHQVSQANGFVAKGLLKWVNFPELVQSKPRFTTIHVLVDGQGIPTELGEDVTEMVRQAWEAVQGKLMAAAIVRMLARAAAGAGTNAAVSNASGDNALGLVAQILVEGAMTAADTPDTRSWNALPAAIFITRVELPAGEHTVAVHLKGPGGSEVVEIKTRIQPGGFIVLPVQTMR